MSATRQSKITPKSARSHSLSVRLIDPCRCLSCMVDSQHRSARRTPVNDGTDTVDVELPLRRSAIWFEELTPSTAGVSGGGLSSWMRRSGLRRSSRSQPRAHQTPPLVRFAFYGRASTTRFQSLARHGDGNVMSPMS